MVELFDRHEVSFVSVTQAFNTTTSMGRLTLNVLLSFAQFEREVTGERIRDKIAAAKRKGMWMGGVPSIGYDVVNRQLVINEAEAAVVRRIFEEMLTIGSPTQIAANLTAEGITTKSWTTQEGQTRSGTRIDKKYLHKLLRNRIYLGELSHKGNWYPGAHPPIIDQVLAGKPIERPYIGIRYTAITRQLAEAEDLPVTDGAWVSASATGPAVEAGTPAADGKQQQGEKSKHQHVPGSRGSRTISTKLPCKHVRVASPSNGPAPRRLRCPAYRRRTPQDCRRDRRVAAR